MSFGWKLQLCSLTVSFVTSIHTIGRSYGTVVGQHGGTMWQLPHQKFMFTPYLSTKRYTFRSDLRWQADKQRKHQNWLSRIENCIFRQVVFVCISKVQIFYNYSFMFSSHSLWEHCNVNLHRIEKNLTIRNLSYQQKWFRDLKRVLTMILRFHNILRNPKKEDSSLMC